MSFEVTVTPPGEVVEITLVGELRADTVAQFEQELVKIAAWKPKRLVLALRDLTYLSSAGVRMLIVIKQQHMGANVDVYVIAPQPDVLKVIRNATLHNSFIIQDSYP